MSVAIIIFGEAPLKLLILSVSSAALRETFLSDRIYTINRIINLSCSPSAKYILIILFILSKISCVSFFFVMSYGLAIRPQHPYCEATKNLSFSLRSLRLCVKPILIFFPFPFFSELSALRFKQSHCP